MYRFFLKALGVGLLCLIGQLEGTFAQKKLIGNSDYCNWKHLEKGSIALSGNGEFICYGYDDGLMKQHLIVVDQKGMRADTMKNVDFSNSPVFSKNNRTLYFSLRGDSLIKYDLIRKTKSYEKGVSNWKVVSSDRQEYLIIGKTNQQLEIKNIENVKSLVIDSVKNYVLNARSTMIAVVSNKGIGLVSLSAMKVTSVGAVKSVKEVLFNNQDTHIFFYGQDKIMSAYVYNIPETRLSVLFDENNNGLPEGYVFQAGQSDYGRMGSTAQAQFNADGQTLIFQFEKKKTSLTAQNNAMIPKMAIWHPNSIVIPDNPNYCMDFAIAVINLQDSKPKLKTIATGFVESATGTGDPDQIFFVRKYEADDRIFYQKDKAPDFLLYSLKSGQTTSFVPKGHLVKGGRIYFSPSKGFATWFDEVSTEFYCYSVITQELINVTKNVKLPNDMRYGADGAYFYRIEPYVHGWTEGDHSFIVRDQYDLWELDPTGIKAPVNLTGGYGRSNNTEFRTIHQEMSSNLKRGDRIIVTALNQEKQNGLAEIKLGSKDGLKMGKMMDKLLYWNIADATFFKKSDDRTDYLVIGQMALESPNLYYTKDLKQFNRLSDIHPEAEYNWLKSELIRYPMKEGKTGSAIIYKPENFDPIKKYPVIFTYYQKRSDGLHEYFNPGMDVNINVPYYVSNGYLVVMPDIINNEPGKIAKTTVNSVVSAVEYLKQYPWFDSTKMGIQGQSFGGYETNILITNTNLFAAAQTSDGASNQAVFGQAFEAGSLTFAERGQTNLNTTLWKNPEIYLENSPIFQADRVTTPLLLTHGRKDTAVDFNQGENMFYALKRNSKPVWLIEYEGGDHANFGNGNGREDFNIRRKQFFDHYLKEQPMPMWMKEPGNLSLDLDTAKKNN
ncbi:alpha/beta hydrolase family protein [Pedobacter sp. GR22-6]|uniref:alpha/beta hydrolase family protein n=1 Tax=Pedobacter sp. GR22-6 TaxID=3127957 RepID=UPI00307E0A3B